MVGANKNYIKDIDNIYENFYEMDYWVIQNNRYSQMENLIILGIPSLICQQDLENMVLNIQRLFRFKKISYNIFTCHHLKSKNDKYPALSIARFINRKLVD